MGGSGGPISPRRTPEQVENQMRRAKEQAFDAGFRTTLAAELDELLGKFNNRDTKLVEGRIAELKQFVSDELDSSIDSFFGGSVAKHTYVDGLSDIDTLFVVKAGHLESNSPAELLRKFVDLVSNKLGQGAQVSAGQMAITIAYPDGMEIQVLPALQGDGGRLKVASASNDGWSSIAPRKFQEALTKRNQECGGKLVPMIKLAKAIIATLPEPQRLSGYHVESLAVDAFRNYTGLKTTGDMLVEFFSRSKTIVQSPIKDSTGQSVHVDEYLGAENSVDRLRRSVVLERIEKRMRNATISNSVPIWRSLFGIDE
tara:strand:+ start:3290 stop:4228 length:939 start_codon:yes stop_codon:yes gene_type:complete